MLAVGKAVDATGACGCYRRKYVGARIPIHPQVRIEESDLDATLERVAAVCIAVWAQSGVVGAGV